MITDKITAQTRSLKEKILYKLNSLTPMQNSLLVRLVFLLVQLLLMLYALAYIENFYLRAIIGFVIIIIMVPDTLIMIKNCPKPVLYYYFFPSKNK